MQKMWTGGYQRRKIMQTTKIKKEVTAFIFAAGLGTRLRPLTNDIPKALVSFRDMPLLGHQILKLKSFGISRFVINIHHFGDKIIDYLKANNNFGVDIFISDERDELLDTGGGLKKATSLLGDGPILIHNVDILTNLDLAKFLASHDESNNIATLCVKEQESDRVFLFDEIETLCGWRNNNTGEEIISRQTTTCTPLAFTGIHILNREFVEKIPQKGVFSIVQSYLELCKTEPIGIYKDKSSNWIDVGTPESLKEAEHYF